MKKNDYYAKREELLKNAENAINDSALFNEIEQKIKNLDAEFENYKKNEALLNTLRIEKNSKEMEMVSNTMNKTHENITNSLEYRNAFKDYVQNKNKNVFNVLNKSQTTLTSDVEVIIPETIQQRIIEKLEQIGVIYNLVNKTNYQGGVKIPKSAFNPEAVWVAENATSDTNKAIVESISFSYNKLRVAISQSYEVKELSLEFFETFFVNKVTQAIIKALEKSILTGTGAGQPKGILKTETVEGQTVTVSEIDYQTLCQIEGLVPQSYENGAVWLMSKRTFMRLMGLVDANGQPIARINYGIAGKAERYILGREVICVDLMPSMDDETAKTDGFACIFNLADYTLNISSAMNVKTYENNETDEQVTKAIMLVDGGVVDNNSLIIIKKSGE